MGEVSKFTALLYVFELSRKVNFNIFNYSAVLLVKQFDFSFQIMDKKNSKIVLFMALLFCLEFVQARPDGPDLPNDEEYAVVVLSQVFGMGSCTTQRFSELTQAIVQCKKQNEAKLQTGGPAPASN